MFDDDDEDNRPIPVTTPRTLAEGDLLPIVQRVALGESQGDHANGAIPPFPPHRQGRAVLDGLTGVERAKHAHMLAHGFKPTVYDYRDAIGRTIFASVRYDHGSERKVPLPLRYCGKDKNGQDLFWFSIPAGTTPLWALDQLAARPEAPVLIVEGEKTAVAAAALFPAYVVTTWPGGAGRVGHVDTSPLIGRNVVAWPDNDITGRRAARVVLAKAMTDGAASAAFVDVPRDFGEGWDLADPVPDNVETKDLDGLLANARPMSSDELQRYLANPEKNAARHRLLGHPPGYSRVPLEVATDALRALDPDLGNGQWQRIARCWYHAFASKGLAAFDEWSSGGDKYRAGEPAGLWASFVQERGFCASPLAWLLRLARRTAEDKQLEGAIDAEAIVVAEIEALNADHAVVYRGGATAVLRETYDPRFERYTCTYIKKQHFVDKHVRKLQLPGQDGKPGQLVPLGKFWFGSAWRREYDGVVFLPGGDAGPRNLNLWRGFAVDPVDNPEGWSKLKAHICDNIAQGDEQAHNYIMNWLAAAVQRLDMPVGTALVLIGEKGTGKSILSVLFGYLFGEHHFATSRANDILGRFNGHLEYALTVGLEEAVAPESRAQDSVFKDVINSKTLTVEEKFMGVWQVPNRLRIILTSNNDHVVRADGRDRRYAVFAVTHPFVADPDARRRYFGEMVEQMENGGYSAMLHELQHRDITGWNPEAIPETEALRRQKLLNLGTEPVRAWLYDRLCEGTHITDGSAALGSPIHSWSTAAPTIVPVQDVRADFMAYANRNGMRASERKFSMDLPKYMPAGFASRVVRLPSGDGSAKTQRVFDFPPLREARDAFAAITGLGDWPPGEVEP